MAASNDLSELLDRIANSEETEGDRKVLRQLLQDKAEQNVVQLGKYTVNLGQGREIQVGDRIYQGVDADTIKTVLQAALQQPLMRSSLTPQAYRNRQALLNKVKNFWIKGVLEASLHHQVVMQLGLEERSQVLVTPWSLGLEPVGAAQPVLPEGTTVIDLFDQLGTGRTLLLLGEPGAGKTITLLQLARELLTRAEQDMEALLPVVFNLSSWGSKSLSIADWLVAELNTKYQIPKAIAQPWIREQQLLLLLDGLDEVRADQREACVGALNQFQQTYGTEMVVCSRIKDYEALSQRLMVQQAIYVRSLQPTQIDRYLNDLNGNLTGLRQLLITDAALQELARSPLMLNIMVLAYEGIHPEDFPQMSAEAHRQRLFDVYIDRMLKRRGGDTRYSLTQTRRWLSWLAQQLVQSSQTIFLIEWLDRSWLQTPRQRWLYTILVSLIVGLAFGVIVALSMGAKQHWLAIGLTVWAIYSLANIIGTWLTMAIERMQPSSRQVFLQRLTGSFLTGLLTGLLFGMVAGVAKAPEAGWLVMVLTVPIVGGLDWWVGGIIGMSFLKPVEALRWSWRNVSRYLIFGLIGSAPMGLILGLSGALGRNLIEGLLLVLLGGLIFGLLTGLRAGAEVETRTTPNQGIWRSAKTSANVAIMVSLGFSFVFYLLSQWLTVSLNWGIFYGLFVGLLMGGTACIVHISLRAVFYVSHNIPWNYAHFLDYAVDRIFLQKVGGGYIFIHRLLMEHFAAMSAGEQR
jgi:DNA polymerase III delta prime subunit